MLLLLGTVAVGVVQCGLLLAAAQLEQVIRGGRYLRVGGKLAGGQVWPFFEGLSV